MTFKALKKRIRDLEIHNNFLQSINISVSIEAVNKQKLLNIANKTIADQITYIKTLNEQLEQQDKAIERKDMQFDGLKRAYKDDLINCNLDNKTAFGKKMCYG